MTESNRFRRYLVWLAIAAAILLVFLVIYVIASSLPPRRFTILTGREGGGYYQAAQMYKRIAAERGFDLQIQTTAGSVETLDMLKKGEAYIGFVQGGTAVNEDQQELSTLASLFYEPVWVFYRQDFSGGAKLTGIDSLRGGRIAIGEPGSGANALNRQLLNANRITPNNTTFLELPMGEAIDQLRNGEIDAGLFVMAPNTNALQLLLRNREIELMDIELTEAYEAQFPFLTSVVLPRGAIDLVDMVPAEDKRLLATAANLIVRQDFHPDLLRLMTIAAVDTHQAGGLFEERFQFPNVDYADLPIGKEEMAYLERIKNGESTFDNYLPFWAAALLDRYLLFVVPVALVVLPLLSRSPILFTIYNRNRVNRWYKTLRQMDLNAARMNKADVITSLAELEQIDKNLQARFNAPMGYMRDFYDLRGHIDLIQGRLQGRLAELEREEAAQEAKEKED